MKLIATPFALAALATPMFLASCDTIGTNPLDQLCCKDFKPGTNMLAVDWGLDATGNAEFGAAMQAVGDFSATAQGMINDLGVACKGMAIDMGADPEKIDEADPNKFTVAWCAEAMSQLATLKASAQLSIVIQPPHCEASFSAKVDCQGKCDATVECMYTPAELKASCSTGKLSGQCSAQCNGKCEGSANLAVTCNGHCEGSCEGNCSTGMMGSQCDGTCDGKCRGTCDVDGSATATCEGTCTGDCSVEFTAPKCKGEFKPPNASCEAKGSCEASCDASASAKAECTPPAVDIEFTASTNVDQKVAALKKWLPQMYLIVEGKLGLLSGQIEAFGDLTAKFNIDPTSSATALFCLPTAVQALADAGLNIAGTIDAGVKIVTDVGVGTPPKK
ncbi:MAG: hypothetical protein U0414_20675 [Polyangiaceae bacterium]